MPGCVFAETAEEAPLVVVETTAGAPRPEPLARAPNCRWCLICGLSAVGALVLWSGVAANPPSTRILAPPAEAQQGHALKIARPSRYTCDRKKSCMPQPKFQGGRLGNCLLDLFSVTIQAITQNLCFVSVPPHDIPYLQQFLDYPSNGILDITEPINGTGLQPWGDEPCVYVGFNPGDLSNSMSAMQDIFAFSGRLRCDAYNLSRPELGPQGVVLSMRSGDVMTPSTPAGKEPQPPCSYYELVVEEGNDGNAFDHVLIVTEVDQRNPCQAVIAQRFPEKVTVQAHSVNDDACVMVSAQNLAIASMSTWGMTLMRFNTNLANAFIPMGLDNGSSYYTSNGWRPNWVEAVKREEGMPYAQHVYSFPGYNTNWQNWWQRVQLMETYPIGSVVKRSIPIHQPAHFIAPFLPCIASYGAIVGGPACCGQNRVLATTDYICPSHHPTCTGYIADSVWGSCGPG